MSNHTTTPQLSLSLQRQFHDEVSVFLASVSRLAGEALVAVLSMARTELDLALVRALDSGGAEPRYLPPRGLERAGRLPSRPALGLGLELRRSATARAEERADHLRSVLAHVRSHPGQCAEEIKQELGTTASRLHASLVRLRAAGALTTTGQARATRYYAAPTSEVSPPRPPATAEPDAQPVAREDVS